MIALACVALPCALILALLSTIGRNRRGGALLPLALGILVLSPLALAGWLGAEWTRWRLCRPERVRRTLARLGVEVGQVECRRLGQGDMNAVLLVTLDGNRRVVLKHMLRFGTLLGWAARTLGATREYPRPLDRRTRLLREVRALRRLRRAGLPVPRCLFASARELVICTEWIEGPDLAVALTSHAPLAADWGRLLARMHALDFAMGDANPRNFAVDRDGRIVPFDLEVSHAQADCVKRGFDLAWAAAFLPDEQAVTAFFAGYGPRTATLDEGIARAHAHLHRYWPLIDLFARRWRATDDGRMEIA